MVVYYGRYCKPCSSACQSLPQEPSMLSVPLNQTRVASGCVVSPAPNDKLVFPAPNGEVVPPA